MVLSNLVIFRTYDPTQYALVLVIRGINCNWKQPIAYYIVSNSCFGTNLNLIIFLIIRKLKKININEKSFITDQISNLIRFFNFNRISPDE